VLLLKLLQSFIKALNSDGTPGQVAAGITLGAVLGLTPLLNLHNLVALSLAIILNVSFPGFILGWFAFVPVGFALDPAFDALGTVLLVDADALQPMWTAMYNTPLALTNFNNTVVLGSVVVWLVVAVPLFFAARAGIAAYRATIYERLQRTRAFRAVKASKVYNVYRLFRP